MCCIATTISNKCVHGRVLLLRMLYYNKWRVNQISVGEDKTGHSSVISLSLDMLSRCPWEHEIKYLFALMHGMDDRTLSMCKDFEKTRVAAG